jgi:two-component system OmpR family sensor kinase
VKIPRADGLDTIRTRIILLLLGIAVLLTLVNMSIILSRPPPREAPLQSFEVARLLRGEPIAKANSSVSSATLSSEPKFHAHTRMDALTQFAVARDLGTSTQNVRFKGIGKMPAHLAFLPSETEAALRLYGIQKFEVAVPHGFRAAVRLPDGRWHLVWREKRDELAAWRNAIIIRLVISLGLVLPIGWFFARWLAEPIRAFGFAAERLGRARRVDHVEVRGPAEIRQAAEALNDMQDRLRHYLVERNAIVGAIAHDLRTPLSRLKFRLAAAPEELRAKAEAEIDEMEELIAASLQFAEAEARAEVRDRLDLGSLVEGIVDDFADLGRPVRLDGVDHAIVRGDPLVLKRMTTNLVNNAVSYGGCAVVRVHKSGNAAIIDIDDEGPGLDTASLPRVFEPFFRVERSRNRSTGGIGLGLAIVRAAATAHGGSVMLRNRSEGGLRATVSLPLDNIEA